MKKPLTLDILKAEAKNFCEMASAQNHASLLGVTDGKDIIAFLGDRNVPGDDVAYDGLADEILDKTPEQGYLTISNALQWRLQYGRVMGLGDTVGGITNYEW